MFISYRICWVREQLYPSSLCLILFPAVMRETLRLAPSAPFRSATPLEDTTLSDGKYAIKAETTIVCGVYMVHRDRKIWGDDVSDVTDAVLPELTRPS